MENRTWNKIRRNDLTKQMSIRLEYQNLKCNKGTIMLFKIKVNFFFSLKNWVLTISNIESKSTKDLFDNPTIFPNAVMWESMKDIVSILVSSYQMIFMIMGLTSLDGDGGSKFAICPTIGSFKFSSKFISLAICPTCRASCLYLVLVDSTKGVNTVAIC